MGKLVRNIIRIDENLCTGCGDCVTSCAEGAIQIVGGKARLVGETYCDGLGACIGDCPTGALTIEQREADDVHQLPREDVRDGINQLVNVFDVGAIEVYPSPSWTPERFQSTRINHPCGSIVIWTRAGY